MVSKHNLGYENNFHRGIFYRNKKESTRLKQRTSKILYFI